MSRLPRLPVPILALALSFVAAAAPAPGAGALHGVLPENTFLQILATTPGYALFTVGGVPALPGCLWRTDGTAAGTFRIEPAGVDCLRPRLVDPVVDGDEVLFVGGPGSLGENRLWRSDGTSAGTVPISHAGINPYGIVPFPDGRVFFAAYAGPGNIEPWISTGSPTGSSLLADLEPGPEGSTPAGATAFGELILFFVDDEFLFASPLHLAVSDGTPGGTRRLFRVPRLLDGSLGFVHDIHAASGGAVFFVRDGACQKAELWRTAGTAGSTRRVASFDRPSCEFGAVEVARRGGFVYFAAEGEAGGGVELWRTDGTEAGTVPVSALPADEPFGGRLPEIAGTGTSIFFPAMAPGAGEELWLSAGAAATSRMVADVCDGPCSSSPSALTIRDGALLFFADDGVHGRELWLADGSAAGTRRLTDVCAGPCPSVTEEAFLALASGRVLFPAADGTGGEELYGLTFSPETVRRLTSFAASRPFGPAYRRTVVGDRLVFAAGDAAGARELWASDGRPSHTVLLRDFAGTASAPPPTPEGLVLERFGSRVTLFWREVLEAGVTGYHVEVRADGGDWQVVFAPERAYAVLELTALPPADVYDFRVRAVSEAGLSAPSTVESVEIEGTCVPGPEVLCLLDGRFAVTVSWHDERSGDDGVGHAVPLPASDRTGTFWFFDPDNVELIVKVLDGRPVNGRFWLFYGALTDVAYTLTVRDTAFGLTGTYFNQQGDLCGDADTSFPDGGSNPVTSTAGFELRPLRALALPVAAGPAGGAAERGAGAGGGAEGVRGATHPPVPCIEDGTTLCLLDDRYAVSVEWRDQHNGTEGEGQAIPHTDLTGFFWFFRPDNVELVVKVLDGTPVNGHVWVFWGALTDVGYTIRVVDDAGHQVREYVNAPGNVCGGADTTAF